MLKELRWSLILAALGFVVLGVILIIWPEFLIKTICYAIAAIMIVIGIAFLIGYIKKDIKRFQYRHDMVVGVSAMIGGVLLILKVDQLQGLIPVMLGFMVTISGILKLQNSIDMYRLGHGTWYVAFSLAAINIAIGVILLINPFSAQQFLIMALGICLIYSGITDLYVTIAISYKLKKIRENAEDSDKHELKKIEE